MDGPFEFDLRHFEAANHLQKMLLHEQHLLGFGEVTGLDPVEVDSTWDIGRVPDNLMIADCLLAIDQCRYNSA